MPQQLPLALAGLSDEAQFESFYRTTDNESTYRELRQAAHSKKRPQFLYLYGPRHSGRTHLLQALCHELKTEEGLYLPLKEALSWGPSVLEDLDARDFLILDDVDAIAGQKKWEEPLFYLMHRFIVAHHGVVVVSAAGLPASLPILMPELSSRLASFLPLPLVPLGLSDYLPMVQQRAALRGLNIHPKIAAHLVKRSGGDLEVLIQLLDQLDHASLVQGRRITLPFTQKVLEEKD